MRFSIPLFFSYIKEMFIYLGVTSLSQGKLCLTLLKQEIFLGSLFLVLLVSSVVFCYPFALFHHLLSCHTIAYFSSENVLCCVMYCEYNSLHMFTTA